MHSFIANLKEKKDVCTFFFLFIHQVLCRMQELNGVSCEITWFQRWTRKCVDVEWKVVNKQIYLNWMLNVNFWPQKSYACCLLMFNQPRVKFAQIFGWIIIKPQTISVCLDLMLFLFCCCRLMIFASAFSTLVSYAHSQAKRHAERESEKEKSQKHFRISKQKQNPYFWLFCIVTDGWRWKYINARLLLCSKSEPLWLSAMKSEIYENRDYAVCV